MNLILKIEIVSDVSCPWCIIGYQSLTQALSKLPGRTDYEISWKPFELNPKMSVEGQDLTEHLQEKYGSTKSEIDQIRNMISERGSDLNFKFNFQAGGRIYNTFNAHRLLYWAQQSGKQTELKLALFSMYFSEGGNLGNTEELLHIVAKVGLPVAEAREIIVSSRYAEEVRIEEAKYQGMGINMVPTFIINNRYKISGGQTVEKFMDGLAAIIIEENKQQPEI